MTDRPAAGPRPVGPQRNRPVLAFDHVDLDRYKVPILREVDWQVATGERWVVLGPNGCGKTTLMQLASGYLHPTRGAVDVLGERLGRTDVRELRKRVAMVSGHIARMVVPHLTAWEVVFAAHDGSLEPWWQPHDDAVKQKAVELLEEAGFSHIVDHTFGTLSEGERQQVLLARAVMSGPELLLLDEPCAGLDMGGRERLLSRLAVLASDRDGPPMIMVTHHVEEIPVGATHLLLMREGRVVATGPLTSTLTEAALSECFGLKLSLNSENGRWTSRAYQR